MIKSVFTAATLALSLVAQSASAESASANLSSLAQKVDLAEAEAAFGRYLDAWQEGQGSAAALESIFTDEAAIELRLSSRPEWLIKVEGSSAIAEYVGRMSKLGRDWTFSAVHYFPTLQQNIVFVQYDAQATASSSGEPIAYRNLVVVTLEQGRIAQLRDFNGAALALRGLSSDEQIAFNEQDR